MQKQIYRQGDVLLVRVEAMPGGLTKVPRDNGRVVLAYGEVTGHAHAIETSNAELYETDLGERFLQVLAEGGVTEADLVHEEHDTVTLPSGGYRQVAQVEYRPWGSQQVAD
jgi:hypothetical protein